MIHKADDDVRGPLKTALFLLGGLIALSLASACAATPAVIDASCLSDRKTILTLCEPGEVIEVDGFGFAPSCSALTIQDTRAIAKSNARIEQRCGGAQ